MLCDVCQSLFCGDLKLKDPSEGSFFKPPPRGAIWDRTYYDHHDNLLSLEASAKVGCHLCVKLLGALSPEERNNTYPRLSDETGELTLERYHIRVKFGSTMPSTREMYVQFGFPNPFDIKFQSYAMVICTLMPEREARGLVVEEEVAPSTNSPQTFAQITQWLSQCDHNHTSCGPPQNDNAQYWRPTRLLYIEATEDALSLRLCEGDQIPQGVEYITLSHCWGSLPMMTLTKDSLSEMKKSISLPSLTKTFQDAIEITRRLNMSYLWIDSLCIIQDVPGDWEQESALMGEIYRHCYCNISATAGADGRSGCFLKRDPLLIEACKVRGTWNHEPWTTFTTIFPDFLSTSFDSEPLNQRAWVVQEHILAPRVLHFCANQLIWECNELIASETAPIGFARYRGLLRSELPVRRKFKGLSRAINDYTTHNSEFYLNRLRETWGYVIKVYSRCNLTRETDKLVALYGVRKDVENLLQDDCLAGLWGEDLEFQLLWKVSGTPLAWKSTSYVAPSWSWASLFGATIELDSSAQNATLYESFISIQDAWVISSGDSNSQEVTGGSIVLCGRLTPGFKYTSIDELDIWPPIRSPSSICPDVRESTPKTPHGDSPISDLPAESNSVWYLPVRTGLAPGTQDPRGVQGLVLARTEEKGNKFRRLGIFTVKLDEDVSRIWENCDAWDAYYDDTWDVHSDVEIETTSYAPDTDALDSKLCDGVFHYDTQRDKYRRANDVRWYTITLI
ncbi:hypothetical protein BP5796_12970 [Coleophoma crateriformis]|uniref:Heterokaryon incompatibility domain-containing protein n=1 Tax=Coleophoma crateriformis TaxID=565419 RepID=A0A3D8Q515_9HELO|nr:hypothetical protein BP5796_12970 [Coleophoma crateriformis]